MGSPQKLEFLITSWVVIAILLGSAALAVRNPQTIPTGGQNFFEFVIEFIRDVSQTQIGEEYGPWVPFIGTFKLPKTAKLFGTVR